MVQRFCEVCNDPLPLDGTGTICDTCNESIDKELELVIAEEMECDTPASAEATSLSGTVAKTTPAPDQDKNTSKNVVVSSADDDLDDWDQVFPMPQTSQPPAPVETPKTLLEIGATYAVVETLESGEVTDSELVKIEIGEKKKPAKGGPCEACGFIQQNLKEIKLPNAREPLLMCDSCYAGEMAIKNGSPADTAMQGKVVRPDEKILDEIISMDDEDRILYNDEVFINASSSIEEVEARVALLEIRLKRAKLQLKASKTTLIMRVEGMEKEKKDKYYREAGERMAKTRKRAQGDATVSKKVSTAPRQKRTKTESFRENMKSHGFSDAWIDDQIKKMGME